MLYAKYEDVFPNRVFPYSYTSYASATGCSAECIIEEEIIPHSNLIVKNVR